MKPTGLCGLVTRIARTLKPWTVVANREACFMMSQKTTALRNRLGTDLRALLVAQHLIPLAHHPHTSPSHITLTHHPHTSPSYIMYLTFTHHAHTSPSHIVSHRHISRSHITSQTSYLTFTHTTVLIPHFHTLPQRITLLHRSHRPHAT